LPPSTRTLSDMKSPVDDSFVLVDGPWTHRFVNANGTRFHVVEAGAGPLVLFLHGFPECWFAWESQIVTLSEAGFRAVAIDLRGYGASDKPPRGYDGYTLAADVAGLIRALGERDAVLVGAGYGGMVAWSTACFQPRLVRRQVVMGAAHPLRLRAGLLSDPRGQLVASLPMLRFQVPRFEHSLTRDGAAIIGGYLRRWAGPGWLASESFAEYERRCRQAFRIPQTAFCALESYRWALRSVLRLQGYRYVKQLQEPITSPTLHLHGALDPIVLPRTALGSGRYVVADYEWRLLDGVGHFPHREAPDLVSGEILRWAKAGS
jgi:pimeloyl-ACP methyl ester carboxylesterase